MEGDAAHEPRESASWRSWFGLPLVLLALHAAMAWIGRAQGILSNEDDARYIVLGRALKHGEYRELWSPASNAHHMYPPGYPAVIGVWTAIGGESFSWLILLQIALGAGTLALVFATLRRVATPVVAICALFVLTVNPFLLEAEGAVMSEIALAFCFAVALWGGTCVPRGRRQTTVVLLAALAAPFMRTAGVTLIAGVVVAWLLEKRYRDAALAAVLGAIVIGPLLFWTATDPARAVGSSYAADLVSKTTEHVPLWKVMALRAIKNTYFYATQGLPYVLPVPTIPGTSIDNVIAVVIIISAIVIAGWQKFRLPLLALLASGGLLIVWPWHPPRFLVPLLPLLVPLLLYGLCCMASFARLRSSAVPVILATLIIGAAGATQSLQHVNEMRGCDRSTPFPGGRCLPRTQASFLQAARLIRDSLPADARIAAGKATALYYHTGRKTVRLGELTALNDSTFWKRLRDDHADYVLLGTLHGTERHAAPRLAARCTELRVVGAFPLSTYLFRIAPNAPPDSSACVAVNEYRRARALDRFTPGAVSGENP